MLGRLRQLPSRAGAPHPIRASTWPRPRSSSVSAISTPAALANRVRRAGEAAALPFRLRAERLHGGLARLDHGRRPDAGGVDRGAGRGCRAPGRGRSARLAVGIVLLRTAGNAEARAMLGAPATASARRATAAESWRRGATSPSSPASGGAGGRDGFAAGSRRRGDRRPLRREPSCRKCSSSSTGPTAGARSTLWSARPSPLSASLATDRSPPLPPPTHHRCHQRVDSNQAGVRGERPRVVAQDRSLLASASVDRARGYLEQTRGTRTWPPALHVGVRKARQTDVWLAVGNYLWTSPG
jgi:hypothetical protein